MNAILGCLKYVFSCKCCEEKPKKIHRSEAIENIAERNIEPVQLKQIKTHHVMKSTDLVTASQFFKQDKEALDESIDRNT